MCASQNDMNKRTLVKMEQTKLVASLTYQMPKKKIKSMIKESTQHNFSSTSSSHAQCGSKEGIKPLMSPRDSRNAYKREVLVGSKGDEIGVKSSSSSQ